MDAKLTIYLKQELIDKALKYADKQGTSLSIIVENQLNSLLNFQENSDNKLPISKKLRGSFKNDFIKNYKNELTDILTQKYF
jgi:hypothetical protein